MAKSASWSKPPDNELVELDLFEETQSAKPISPSSTQCTTTPKSSTAYSGHIPPTIASKNASDRVRSISLHSHCIPSPHGINSHDRCLTFQSELTIDPATLVLYLPTA